MQAVVRKFGIVREGAASKAAVCLASCERSSDRPLQVVYRDDTAERVK